MTEEKSQLLIDKKKEIQKTPKYTTETKVYLRNLQKRLNYAIEQRNMPKEEFDGMTFLQYWQKNESEANTYIKPKTDKKEITFQSGTLRQKLDGFLASLESLNLKPDIFAFNRHDVMASSLGQGMEDIIDKTNEIEEDEEKSTMRRYELMKQGTIFVEELWEENEVIDKEFTSDFDGKFDFKGWKMKTTTGLPYPKKEVISNLNVYLGDLNQYFIKDQPYVFTIKRESYDSAERLYEDWENWKYVSRQKVNFTHKGEEDLVEGKWRMTMPIEGEVEIIKYQDLPNNEFQIVINGIPMIPPGFPLPQGRYYNIAQQNFAPIRHNFAYGKSFTFKNKNIIGTLDEMIRMALLKTYKSFMPPYLNTSGRVISSSIFMPGKISMGVQPGSLQPVHEHEVQGVTPAEFNMQEQMIRFIDQNTASQTFTGAKEKGQTTATQIVELQRQARIMLGLTILSASLLEKKLTFLRLNNILKNWFNPLDKVVSATKGMLKNKYRVISRQRMIEKEGKGFRFVVPTDEKFKSQDIYNAEEEAKQMTGKPVRFIFINPNELEAVKYTWMITVNPKEKKSSEMNKLMFSEMIGQATALGLQLNPEYISQEFALVWDKDPAKLFLKGQPAQQQPEQGVGGQPQRSGGVQKPSVAQVQKQPNQANLR